MAGRRFPTNLQYVETVTFPGGLEKDLWTANGPNGPITVEVNWPAPKEKQ